MDQDENRVTIGHIAQYLDAEYSLFERMKIKKVTVRRLGYAVVLYICTMIFFAIVL
jgi:hypothetical protein